MGSLPQFMFFSNFLDVRTNYLALSGNHGGYIKDNVAGAIRSEVSRNGINTWRLCGTVAILAIVHYSGSSPC